MAIRVPLVWGTATFGEKGKGTARTHTVSECQEYIDLFVGKGGKIIDTARVYGEGTAEELISKLNLKGAVLDTKIASRSPGSHSPENLRESLETSVKTLAPHKIRVLYLHAPDRSTPFEVIAKEIDALHKKGLFEEFGLSNFLSWEVAEFVTVARANGWIQPTVYQGIYNALERNNEFELFPALRKYGIRFYGYSPLASGLLTGKWFSEAELQSNAATGTRWDPKAAGSFADLILNKYRPLLPVLKPLKEALDQHNITFAQAALRWLQHHSALTPEDGVILGASSVKQLEANIIDSEGGPLPDEVVQLLENAWLHGGKENSTWYCRRP